MINFWSYKNEYSKYRPQLVKFFDTTLKSGQIFFGQNLHKSGPMIGPQGSAGCCSENFWVHRGNFDIELEGLSRHSGPSIQN